MASQAIIAGSVWAVIEYERYLTQIESYTSCSSVLAPRWCYCWIPHDHLHSFLAPNRLESASVNHLDFKIKYTAWIHREIFRLQLTGRLNQYWRQTRAPRGAGDGASVPGAPPLLSPEVPEPAYNRTTPVVRPSPYWLFNAPWTSGFLSIISSFKE